MLALEAGSSSGMRVLTFALALMAWAFACAPDQRIVREDEPGGDDLPAPDMAPARSGGERSDVRREQTEAAPRAPTVDSLTIEAETSDARVEADVAVSTLDASPPSAGGKRPVAPSAGCGAADQLPEGEGRLPNGRRFAVHLPTAYDKSRPWPLVFANHSNGGNFNMFARATTRDAMKGWAIMVRTASQTGDWRDAHAADLAYFDALVPLLKQKLCVDENRVFSFGHSGGGSFSAVLACKRSFLGGFGSNGGVPGGSYNYSAADCKTPLPAWISHGGRTGLERLWKERNGCTGETQAMPDQCKRYECGGAPMFYCGPNPHSWPPFPGADESVAAFLRAL